MTIHPSGTVSTCNGDQVELTCTTSGIFHEWIFYVVPDNEFETNTSQYSRVFSVNGDRSLNLTVNSIKFTFWRKSEQGSTPLTTSLIIDPINKNYLGAEVACVDTETRNSSSIFLNIINGSDMHQQGIVHCHDELLCILSVLYRVLREHD